jgi:N6-adenosine-specific RNA methylase IME4
VLSLSDTHRNNANVNVSDVGTKMGDLERTVASLLELKRRYADGFSTILADPPWRFKNRTGKVAPEHRRLYRYSTLSLEELMQLPVGELARPRSHLYLWCPNALLPQGLRLMEAWGFEYKTMLVWYKVRKDGGPDGRGVGFYFRNVTEPLLFGVRGGLRTLAPGRRQVNIIISRKMEHSTKPPIVYGIIQSCSLGPYLELFARRTAPNWVAWGDEVDTYEQQRPRHRGYDWGIGTPFNFG